MQISLICQSMKLHMKLWRFLFYYRCWYVCTWCIPIQHKFGGMYVGECVCICIQNVWKSLLSSRHTDSYLQHHGATSGGWSPDSLYKECLEEFGLILRPFVSKCTNPFSCGWNVCLRQPPLLRSLTCHRVFHLTFNLSEFMLNSRTLYHQYLYAVQSNVVPVDSIIPLTFPKFQCTFLRDKRSEIRKRFHKDCIIPSERY